MLKKFLVILAMLFASVGAFAAVDVNKASAAELDSVKGIGPVMSKRIMDERKKGEFKSWEDLITRVKGVGEGNAAKFSSEGLTVGGESYKKAAMKEEKKSEKSAKKDDKADKKEEKKDAKADKKEAKAEKKEDKKDEKKESAKPAASSSKPSASAAKK